MYIRIAFSIELRLRVSRSLRSLANNKLDSYFLLSTCFMYERDTCMYMYIHDTRKSEQGENQIKKENSKKRGDC